MILSFRFSSASLLTVLALGVITVSCSGGSSTPSGGQAQSLTDVSLTAQSAPLDDAVATVAMGQVTGTGIGSVAASNGDRSENADYQYGKAAAAADRWASLGASRLSPSYPC
jgi:hypothetical protein